MGKESKTNRWRKCPYCNVELPQTAQELREHAITCSRMVALGLQVGGIIDRSCGGIIIPGRNND